MHNYKFFRYKPWECIWFVNNVLNVFIFWSLLFISAGPFSFQAQLYKNDGKIILAYKNVSLILLLWFIAIHCGFIANCCGL